MKLSSAFLLATASAELEFDDLGKNSGNTARQERTLGNLSAASANKISTVQAGGQFPHVNDILYTQSQAQMFASLGMSVPSHQISSAPAWKEQLETNGNARGLANTVLDGRLWTQHPYPANCDFETNSQCKYLVPFYYAAGTTTQARERISSAMANIESKTCLRFQFLSNPGHSTYLNKKKLRVVTTTNLCASYVGANYQEQEIYLSQNPADNCGLNATAVEHEILHAIGLYHENQRPDVEKYIQYNWANIRQDMTQQQINTDYGVIPDDQFLNFDSHFDFGSIMLIGSTDNARPCTNTDGSICEADTSITGAVTMCSDTCESGIIKTCEPNGANTVSSIATRNVCDYFPGLGGWDGSTSNPGNFGAHADVVTEWQLHIAAHTTVAYADLGITDTTGSAEITCAGTCTDDYNCPGDCAAPHPSLVHAGLPGGFDPATYQTYMRVYTKLDTSDGRPFQSEAGTAYNLATSLSDDDAWQINSLYGCEAYKKEYMHKCASERYEMTHSFGMDLKCNERTDMCPLIPRMFGGFIDWSNLTGMAMGGDGSDESECHACAVGQHSCDAKASCTMVMGPLGVTASTTAGVDCNPSTGAVPCTVGMPDEACSSGVSLHADQPLYTCWGTDSHPTCSCDITPKVDEVMTQTVGTLPIPTQSEGTATDYLKGNGNTIASGGTGCIDVNECVDVAKCRYDNTAYNTAATAAGAPADMTPVLEIRLPCIDHDPGFECVCPQGQVHPEPYDDNAFQHLEECVDEDECKTGNHECPSNTICHNLFCEGNSFFGKPCGYGEGYVCACPFNTHTSPPTPYSTAAANTNLWQCLPTDAHAIPSHSSGCTKLLTSGAQGIHSSEHPDFDDDKGEETNIVATGHPSTGFTCPNMNQCSANTVHEGTWGAVRAATYSAFMNRDQCLLCKSTGLPVIGPDGTPSANCLPPSTAALTFPTDFANLLWYDPGTICMDHDDSIPGQPTHTCRCPKGAAPEYYTHSFLSQFDMDDGVLDGQINLTQGLQEKGWFDITAYYKNSGPYETNLMAGTSDDLGLIIEGQLLASGIINEAPIPAGGTANTPSLNGGSGTVSPFFSAHTGNTAYGIQYSSQYGNNGNQAETFPATNGAMAFFVVKFDAATKTWTSDIPWQCVEVDHCSNTICPGRTVRGIGCQENPFYSLTNFMTNDPTNYGAYQTAYTTTFAINGFYNVPELLTAASPMIDMSTWTQEHTQSMAALTNRRDNIHTTEPDDIMPATPHGGTDQTSDTRTILFWDKDQNAITDPTAAGYGQLFDGSTTELWVNSVDYSGVAEGLPYCNTCDNVLTEWNYFDQICSDKDECKMHQTLYDAYVKTDPAVNAVAAVAGGTEASYLADHELQCSTEYFPTTSIRRNNIMPTGSSITSATGGGAVHMDCQNRGPYNSDHGFKCECPPGSEMNTAGTHCVDIQECRLGQHTCGWLPCIDFCAWGSSDGEIPNARWSTVTGDDPYTLCGYDHQMTGSTFDIMAYQVQPALYGKDQVIMTIADFTYGGAIAGATQGLVHYRPGGFYTCQCPEGLRWNATTRTCDDINECIELDIPCGRMVDADGQSTIAETGTRCVNTEGTYWCACSEGYHNDDLQEQFVIGQDDKGQNIYIDPSQCDATKCQKDSALIGTPSASLSGYCGNTDAEFSLCECTAMDMCTGACYELNDDQTAYTDVLTAGSIVGHNCHLCHPNAECRSNYNPNGTQNGTYDCYCSINSAQNGRTECNDGDQCAVGAVGALDCASKGLACNDLDTGYECVCLNSTGYSVNSVSGHCEDINECVDTPDVCGADGQCINEDGTYTCSCYNGYDLVVTGRSVTAIPGDSMNEMRSSHGGRSPAGIVEGNWQIYAINQVASQSRTGGRERQFTCKDSDECATGNNYCVDANLGGTCINLNGGHTCACGTGYVGDGNDESKYNALILGLGHDTTLNNNQSTGWVAPGFNNPHTNTGSVPLPSSFIGCVDVDECFTNNGGCHSTGVCVNLPGSYECRCPAHLPIGSGTSGCYADTPVVTVAPVTEAPITIPPVGTDAPVTAAPVIPVAVTTAAPETHSGPMVYNDFNCAGHGSVCEFFSCADDIAVHCFGSQTCGVSCKNGGSPMGLSAVSCTNTGKAKKQGWKNGGSKLSGGEALTCGAAVNAPTGGGSASGGSVSSGGSSGVSSGGSSGGWCGVGDLNAYFGVGSQYKFNCKAGSKKCKVKCSGGGKPNPKKLKCSGGKLKTSSMGGC